MFSIATRIRPTRRRHLDRPGRYLLPVIDNGISSDAQLDITYTAVITVIESARVNGVPHFTVRGRRQLSATELFRGRRGLRLECQLLLITNKKSHTCFRLVPTSTTLNDIERRNNLYFAFFFTEIDRFSGRLYHSGCR